MSSTTSWISSTVGTLSPICWAAMINTLRPRSPAISRSYSPVALPAFNSAPVILSASNAARLPSLFIISVKTTCFMTLTV